MKKLIVSVLTFLPVLSFAQTLTNIDDVATKATRIGNLVIEIAISLAVIWIIINVIKYLIAGGEDQRAAGGKAILFGVIGLFVILSIWGLVAILTNSFKTNSNRPTNEINTNVHIPALPTTGN